MLASSLSLIYVIRKKSFKDLSLTLSLSHACVISAFASLLYFPIKTQLEASLTWTVFLIADFPASLLFFLTSHFFPASDIPMSSLTANWFIPYITLCLLGSAQYYLIGKLFKGRNKNSSL
jgi:hypothetical protein